MVKVASVLFEVPSAEVAVIRKWYLVFGFSPVSWAEIAIGWIPASVWIVVSEP